MVAKLQRELRREARRAASRARYDFWSIAAQNARTFFPLARLSPNANKMRRVELLSASTVLTAEGFPGSGNTRLYAIFRYYEERVAHHAHAAAQVVASVAQGVPTVVVVRDPVDAVTSFVARHGKISLGQALREYVRFHRRLMPLRDELLVVRFDDVVQNPGEIVARVDRRFGLDCSARGVPSSEELGRIIKAWHAYGIASPRADFDAPVPSTERIDMKQALKARLTSDRHARRLRTAKALFETFEASAP